MHGVVSHHEVSSWLCSMTVLMKLILRVMLFEQRIITVNGGGYGNYFCT